MVWRPTRILLYSMVWVFSVILIGMTASRIHFTRNQPIGFYEPVTAEILATSILALLWSTVMILALVARAGGALASFFSETFMGFIIWVLYLVGNAIFSHKFAHIGRCRRFAEQCRIITAIMAFAWINWALFTFLLFLSLAHLIATGGALFTPIYGEGEAVGGPETRERPAAV